jgi:hypothetical protein
MPAETLSDATEQAALLTVGRISAGMESHLVPLIGQILRIIRDISGKSDSMSVDDLVEFINGEPTMMTRIVTIASSVGYNAGGMEISSIHHAISLIGFDRVRTLAISTLLLESAHSEYAAKVNRELAGTALIGGMVAAEMCRRGVAADPELAFICGALRNYGRMLAATFMPEEYAAATTPPLRPGLDEAFRSVFGLTALNLGRQIMRNLSLPRTILNTMVSLSLQERRFCSSTAIGTLTGAADFGLRFAELLQAPDLNHLNYERRIEMLSREYDVDYCLSRNEAREMIQHLVGMLECFRYRAGSYAGSVAMFRRLEQLVAERILPTTVELASKPLSPHLRPTPVIESADSYEI